MCLVYSYQQPCVFWGGHVLGETVYVQYVQENPLGLTAETAKIGCSIIPCYSVEQRRTPLSKHFIKTLN